MIYIVTRGEYSDYCIVAATTNKKMAKQIRDKVNAEDKWADAEIEEFVDSQVIPLPLWSIDIDKTGKVTRTYCDNDYSWESFYNGKEYVKENPGAGNGPWIAVNVRAKDKESAIKIAAERRAKYLAEKLDL